MATLSTSSTQASIGFDSPSLLSERFLFLPILRSLEALEQ